MFLDKKMTEFVRNKILQHYINVNTHPLDNVSAFVNIFSF